MHVANILPYLSILTTAVSALGTNCKGSAECGGGAGAAQTLVDLINTVDDNRKFFNGEKIACDHRGKYDLSGTGICAFLQNVDGYKTGWEIKYMAHFITDDSCYNCGSVPFDWKDVSNGQLTFNYVTVPCQTGQGDQWYGLC